MEGKVMKQVVQPPHSFRISSLILGLNYWLWIMKSNNETKDAPRCECVSRVPCIVLVFNTPQ